MNAAEPENSTSALPVQTALAPPGPLELPDLCPYLATEDGSWRSSSAVRDHRCLAVSPPVPLALEKQRRLCLAAEHVQCATYGAAMVANPPAAPRESLGFRAVARTTPVILDHGRFDWVLPIPPPNRMAGQGILVGLLGLAFAALLLARPSGEGAAVDGPSVAATSALAGAATQRSATPTSNPRTTPKPTGAPVVTARPIGSPASGDATPAPAVAVPTASPPAVRATYKVKSGDTLTAIASRNGTTIKVLMTLNGITDPSKLHVGQILKLP